MTIYVTDRQLAERYKIARQTVWRWAQRGVIPQPVRLTDQCTRWRLDEVEKRDSERGAA